MIRQSCESSTCVSRAPCFRASRFASTSGTWARAMLRSKSLRRSATWSPKISVASSTPREDRDAFLFWPVGQLASRPVGGLNVLRLRRRHDHDRLRSPRAVRRHDEGADPEAAAERTNHRRDARGAGVLAGGGGVLAV